MNDDLISKQYASEKKETANARKKLAQRLAEQEITSEALEQANSAISERFLRLSQDIHKSKKASKALKDRNLKVVRPPEPPSAIVENLRQELTKSNKTGINTEQK